MRLRLIQPRGGRPLGSEVGSEKEFIVELKRNFDRYTEHRQYLLTGNGLHIWGAYRLRDSNGYPISNRSVGRQLASDSKFKIWAYNPGELSLHFLTISTDHRTGAGEVAPDQIEIEVDLYHGVLLGSRVSPSGGGTKNGRVHYSFDGEPFRVGEIFWEAI